MKNKPITRQIKGVHCSLIHTLKVFLELPGIFGEIKNYMSVLKNEKKVVCNFLQADLYKRKYSRLNKDYIPVLGYFDEFETGNDLGSHSGEQKFGGFYISLICLPPRLLHRTDNIFVSSVFRAKYLPEYGTKMVFKKDISDLKYLHDNGLKLKNRT